MLCMLAWPLAGKQYCKAWQFNVLSVSLSFARPLAAHGICRLVQTYVTTCKVVQSDEAIRPSCRSESMTRRSTL